MPCPGPTTPRTEAFLDSVGLVVDEANEAAVKGHIELGADHHNPWGIVNGGVYTTVVEEAASIGARAAAAARGLTAVAVHVSTDLLAASTEGRAEVTAEPVHQTRTQQLWVVRITAKRPLARGQVRLVNLEDAGSRM